MKKLHSPSDIEVLIHCYVSPNPHPRLYAPAIEATVCKFLENSIVEPTDDSEVYKVTPRGKAWLDMILATPYPIQEWKDPREGGDHGPKRA